MTLGLSAPFHACVRNASYRSIARIIARSMAQLSGAENHYSNNSTRNYGWHHRTANAGWLAVTAAGQPAGRQQGADDYCTDKSLGCLPWWAGLLVAGGLLCLSCWRWFAPRRLSSGLVETRTDSHSTTHTKDKLTKLSRKLLVFSIPPSHTLEEYN